MDYLNQNIAINLKRIRQARGMSLDLVAEQTGVSKSMLGQIERGEANPTIGILGRIVSGLRIGLDSLARIARHPALQGLPFCLETPNDLSGYQREIQLMRQLCP